MLKIDHFERVISEHFPIAHDGIHMKFLNLELFISKALTFSYNFFNFYVFIVVQNFGPWTPLLFFLIMKKYSKAPPPPKAAGPQLSFQQN